MLYLKMKDQIATVHDFVPSKSSDSQKVVSNGEVAIGISSS